MLFLEITIIRFERNPLVELRGHGYRKFDIK